ncbi:hypothetical protein [Flavobacterium urocaniciphilum]|uniref:Uncharacterized protein n=1 Tax=Flavobacterium urocaniciphilum TaxID=1299341 RepID=A0A1H9BGW5_9FLAO|nr:hypothetical protein [Flavobacterium urocaniciphilum]SEP88232.1 hypothetical protein SAMN05444005_10313 [Flavobacterium urocaniciphilum]
MRSNKNNKYKFITLVLSVFLLIVLFKSYKDNKQANELQNSLKQESLLTQNQLSEILNKYDSLNSIYNSADESFSKLNIKSEDKIINKFEDITQINLQILKIEDSIKLLKNKLKEYESLRVKFTPKTEVFNIVEKSKSDAKFEVTNLQVKGVKFLNENASPKKSNTIEQIRVCFTLDKNVNIASGEKEFFIQVVNPKNDIISVNNLTYEKDNVILKYSKMAKFTYSQKITDVCSYIDLEKNKTLKGKYIVNLYSGINKISSTIFNYN